MKPTNPEKDKKTAPEAAERQEDKTPALAAKQKETKAHVEKTLKHPELSEETQEQVAILKEHIFKKDISLNEHLLKFQHYFNPRSSTTPPLSRDGETKLMTVSDKDKTDFSYWVDKPGDEAINFNTNWFINSERVVNIPCPLTWPEIKNLVKTGAIDIDPNENSLRTDMKANDLILTIDGFLLACYTDEKTGKLKLANYIVSEMPEIFHNEHEKILSSAVKIDDQDFKNISAEGIDTSTKTDVIAWLRKNKNLRPHPSLNYLDISKKMFKEQSYEEDNSSQAPNYYFLTHDGVLLYICEKNTNFPVSVDSVFNDPDKMSASESMTSFSIPINLSEISGQMTNEKGFALGTAEKINWLKQNKKLRPHPSLKTKDIVNICKDSSQPEIVSTGNLDSSDSRKFALPNRFLLTTDGDLISLFVDKKDDSITISNIP